MSQGAAMDGAAAVLNVWSYAGQRQLLRLIAHAAVDIVWSLLKRRPHHVQLAGEPESLAAMSTDDSLPGYSAIWGPSFVNQMAARGLLLYRLNRPVTRAKRLRIPVHLMIANYDSIAPTSGMEKVAKRVRGPVRVERLDAGHFDIYLGDPFEQIGAGGVPSVALTSSDVLNEGGKFATQGMSEPIRKLASVVSGMTRSWSR